MDVVFWIPFMVCFFIYRWRGAVLQQRSKWTVELQREAKAKSPLDGLGRLLVVGRF
jgi:hypothetical protein